MSTAMYAKSGARTSVPASAFLGQRSVTKKSVSASFAQPQLARSARSAVTCTALAQPTAVPTAKTNKPMNIVFVAAEAAPWSKTGGLGDVLGGLPIELAKRGHSVMSIAPRCVSALLQPREASCPRVSTHSTREVKRKRTLGYCYNSAAVPEWRASYGTDEGSVSPTSARTGITPLCTQTRF